MAEPLRWLRQARWCDRTPDRTGAPVIPRPSAFAELDRSALGRDFHRVLSGKLTFQDALHLTNSRSTKASFMAQAGTTPGVRFFSGSLGMARQFGMKTVAEGVEDREDWNFLRQQGCDLAQGYFIARPMPAGKLRAWLADWEARHTELLAE